MALNVIDCPVTAPPRTGVSATLTAGGGGGMDFEPQAIKATQGERIEKVANIDLRRVPRVRFMAGASSRVIAMDIEIS